MSLGAAVDTVALGLAAVNIVLLLSILSRLTEVAEAPRAWNFLTIGIALVVIHVSIDVFITVNQYFSFAGMQLLSATVSFLGFLFLFAGVHRVWTVVYA
ncbi:MAG: hypothetical protein ABEI97_02420 [Candidatus Nanohaloarchaea archaeon]